MSIEKFLSPYVANQLPRLYREEGPVFISFIKAYYEFMEQQGEVLNEARSLLEYRDIDTTLPEFIQYFRDKYMTGVPESLAGDPRLLQKHIKEIYSSKGTVRGLELVFRLLANQSIDVYYPGDDILKPSDGVWIKPVYLEVSTNSTNVLLVGEQITGRESGATAIVEDFQSRYINRRKINVLYLSNVRGHFKTGELLLNNIVTDPLQSPAVIGSMTDILVNESGFDYKVGDVLDVIGGSGILGKAVVSNTSPRSGSVEFVIINGGSGYANDNIFAPSTVTVSAIDGNNPGIGATFSIGQLGDTEIITTAVDEIAPYANVSLASVDYGFHSGSPDVNINTPLDQALNIQNITVGTILTLRAINPGAGYNGPVNVVVTNDVIGGLNIVDELKGNTIKGLNANVSGSASSGRGAIDSVKIFDAGLGYQQGDVVVLQNETNPFIAGGSIQLGQEGVGAGYWKDTRSFLNSDKFIQDSFYYQEYSFEVRVALAFQRYSDILKRLWQPAGTEAFGKVVVGNEIETGSRIEEVKIDAIFITEYVTSFSTFIETNRLTSTEFASMYATTYYTEAPTTTQRSTTTVLLDSIAERIVNGTFNVGIANWTAFGDSVVTWDATEQRMKIERVTQGRASQAIATTAGKTYYVQATVTDSTANVQIYASTSDLITDQFASGNSVGPVASENVVFTFIAPSAVTYIITNVSGTGEEFYVDDISVKELPDVSRATAYATNLATDTTFVTDRITNRSTTTTFETGLVTTYVTQRITLSAFSTDRLTNRATATIFNTTFETSAATNRITDTNRVTTLATNRATDTTFDTTYNTFYATNRATTTLGITSFETNRVTTAVTSTVYDTTFNTTRSTTTTFGTDRTTNRLTDTTISTAFVTTFVTTFGTEGSTTTTFDTSRTTSFGTTIVTSFVSAYVTLYATNRATATSQATSRATATSRDTSRATATSRSTSRGTATSRSTTTTFNTTTTFDTTIITFTTTNGPFGSTPGLPVEKNTEAPTSRSTATSRATTTVYDTTTTYVTTYDTTTTYNTTFNTTTTYITTFNTTTTFDTSRGTSVNTSRNTTFDTSRTTTFATSRSTATTKDTSRDTTRSTVRNTSFATLTTFITAFNTSRATDTTVVTNRSTQRATDTTGLTTFDTTRDTSIITDTTFDTFQPTTRSTNRSTTTAFNTDGITTFGTLTAFNTVFNTDRSTLRITNTAYITTYDTTTLKITDAITSRITFVATDRVTTTEFVTSYNTNRATTTVFDTEILTTFVDIPTTFQTFYDTLTTVATDVDTGIITQRDTVTAYDTAYETSRVTSINTSTDLAND